jgi:hypothetical protein
MVVLSEGRTPDGTGGMMKVNQRVWWTSKDGSRTLFGVVESHVQRGRVTIKCEDGFVARVSVDRLNVIGD